MSDDSVDAVNALGAQWSPNMDEWVEGKIPDHELKCALCLKSPCACPPFGTPEYFALIDQRHGKRR